MYLYMTMEFVSIRSDSVLAIGNASKTGQNVHIYEIHTAHSVIRHFFESRTNGMTQCSAIRNACAVTVTKQTKDTRKSVSAADTPYLICAPSAFVHVLVSTFELSLLPSDFWLCAPISCRTVFRVCVRRERCQAAEKKNDWINCFILHLSWPIQGKTFQALN